MTIARSDDTHTALLENAHQMTHGSQDLFPAFQRFVVESGMQAGAKGHLTAKLPRILGQGSTRAIGLEAPPAPIERKQELVTLDFTGHSVPPEVAQEVRDATADIERLKAELRREEGIRKLATRAIEDIEGPRGLKDGHFFAGHLILSSQKGGLEWSWSVTPHYPIVKRLPPDAAYLTAAYHAAQEQIKSLTLSSGEFESTIRLAWTLARHFSRSDDVLVTDVMKMFNVAAQPSKFWQSPRRQFYSDLPDAAFVVNLIQWKLSASPSAASDFEFVPATLHQAHGADAKVFFFPMNPEGTEVRPMAYMRRRVQGGDK